MCEAIKVFMCEALVNLVIVLAGWLLATVVVLLIAWVFRK